MPPRARLAAESRARLRDRLQLAAAEYDSLAAVMHGEIELSRARLLGEAGEVISSPGRAPHCR